MIKVSKIEIAYSLEYGDCIDAEEAYELYSIGVITDKQSFVCCDEECDAQITCSNLDKERADMKRSPYFKCFGEHSDKCKHILDYEEASIASNNSKRHGQIKAYQDNYDNFFLERPGNHIAINKIARNEIKPNIKTVDEIKEIKKIANGNHISNYYCIRPIVSKFIKYGDNVYKNYISIKGYKISYNNFFVDISDQEIDAVSKYNRIYWGCGQIKEKGDKYIITFDHGFLMNDQKLSTLCIIEKSTLNNYYFKNSKTAEIERGIKQKSALTIYIYSRPNQWANSNHEKFVFLNISNLDYIDFR